MVIILDMGSGETCWNNRDDVRDMIKAVDDNDPREVEIILKWQLFRGGEFSHLKALHPGVFAYAYDYARQLGYATTASVFDESSVRFLQSFTVPFVKIACVENCRKYRFHVDGYWIDPSVMSFAGGSDTVSTKNALCCVREYPAKLGHYEAQFTEEQLEAGISDHTDHTKGMDLIEIYRPKLYETHFCLESQTGPDTGPFALRPNQLRDMLEAL